MSQQPATEPYWLLEARRRDSAIGGYALPSQGASYDRQELLKALDAATARVTRAESREAELKQELAEQEKEKLALVQELELVKKHRQYLLHVMEESEGFGARIATELGIEYVPAYPDFAAPAPLPSSPAAAPPPVAVTFQPAPPTGCKCSFIGRILGDGCEKCNPECFEDEREVIGAYEISGLPVYEGDDYVTDVEGCYLTRDEANALKADDELRAATTTGEGKEGLKS